MNKATSEATSEKSDLILEGDKLTPENIKAACRAPSSTLKKGKRKERWIKRSATVTRKDSGTVIVHFLVEKGILFCKMLDLPSFQVCEEVLVLWKKIEFSPIL